MIPLNLELYTWRCTFKMKMLLRAIIIVVYGRFKRFYWILLVLDDYTVNIMIGKTSLVSDLLNEIFHGHTIITCDMPVAYHTFSAINSSSSFTF